MDELKSNIHGIIRSEVNDVNLLLDVRRPAIEACRSQSTNWFLSLVLLDNVLKSTGIDSSKEGLDVSPINDMKQTQRCNWWIK
jgi:hypothetical protein